MELRDYLRIAQRRWWILLLGIVIVALPIYLYTDAQPRTFRASALVFVNQSATANEITYSDAMLSQQLVKTYSRMATEPVVLDEVISTLDLSLLTSELKAMVHAAPVRETQLLEISVIGRSPQLITDIANATAETFIEQQTVFLPEDQQGSALRVAQPALVPASPIGPMPLRNAILGGLLGLLLAAGLVWLLEYLDDTVKTPESLEHSTGLATLGAVMRHGSKETIEAHVVTSTRNHSPAAEAYRLIRTNLEFASVDRDLSTILVTSANAGEGKTTTTVNMAAILAKADRKVIVVDADLRRPSLHKVFEVNNRMGLSSLLLNPDISPQDYLRATGMPGLSVLPSGPIPPNPSELLASPRLSIILERLSDLADVVIIDSSPVLMVADPVIVASKVDGTVLVVDSSKTRGDVLGRATDQLAKSGTLMLGAVLNKLPRRAGNYYYYYYGKGYGDDDGNPPTQKHRRYPKFGLSNLMRSKLD